ncbi:hypothetical protein [Streptomyces albipurpureus]|uniref:Uncharacterized protein n=1 Tax=Streptomyces albipurpureus TaxID=2897419 RepID=A0ABT0UW18_9ACTN|nr:hypothetical protein [Streptomyces sp. CWNU-1]MCM2392597.1 hypothetical protein [Streptomyces sp. CWNU-1]
MQTDNTYTYAGRDIVHRTPMPDGRMLILAYGGTQSPWATGFLGEDNGSYFGTRRAGWQSYAKRMAEGLGLMVAPEGSVVLSAEQINRVQAGAADLAKSHDDFEKALGTDNCEPQVRLRAEDNITEAAMDMGNLLRGLRLYTPANTPDEGGEGEPAVAETPQYTTETFVEAVTNGEN